MIITDYSAVIFEISLLNKPLFFYAYDKDEYTHSRDFYLDYNKMPGVISKSPKQIIKSIENKEYDISKIKEFSKYNIEKIKNGYTNNIVNFIIKMLK